MNASERFPAAETIESKRTISFSKTELDGILSDPDHTPEQLIGLLSRDFDDVYAQSVGVTEGYTLGKHTTMVLRQYKKYFANAELPGGVSPKLFEFILALHDIGKPRAIRERARGKMHAYTSDAIRSILTQLSGTEAEIRLAIALTDGNPVGTFLEFGGLEAASREIVEMAARSGLALDAFFDLLLVYFQTDAGSYTRDAGGEPSLDALFVFDAAAGQMALNPRLAEQVMELRAAAFALDAESRAEKRPLGETITERMNAPEYLAAVNAFPDEVRDKVIGLTLEYFSIDPEGAGLSAYLENLREMNPPLTDHSDSGKFRFLIDAVAARLGITDTTTPDAEEKIFAEIRTSAIDNGYFFHGYNGTFERDIREHGLDPHRRHWDWQELGRISAIGDRVGEGRLLGWSRSNSRGKISIGNGTNSVYRYANASPEWFAQFVAEGYHIPLNHPYDKDAFARKDYAAAKRNVTLLIERLSSRREEDILARKAYPNLTAEECDEILRFFEKTWAALCGDAGVPKVILLKNKAIHQDRTAYQTFPDYVTFNKRIGSHIPPTLENAIEHLFRTHEHIDTQIDVTVDPNDLLFVTLPKYTDVHRNP